MPTAAAAAVVPSSGGSSSTPVGVLDPKIVDDLDLTALGDGSMGPIDGLDDFAGIVASRGQVL